MTTEEQRELLGLVMAAMQAAVPDVPSEKRALVLGVLDGMLREHSESRRTIP